jgi:c-di-GMP-binding flagellar brake protein YcgR
MDDFLEFEEIRQEYERLKFPWEERRAFPRLQEALPVRFMGEEIQSHLFSIDVGGGGVRIVTQKPLNPTRTYEFELLLKGFKDPIRVKGKPVWTRPLNIPNEYYESGLMFLEINAEDQEKIVQYAKKQPPLTSDEKRKYLRVPRLLLVSLTQDSEEKTLAGLIMDISLGGARILTSKLLPSKSVIDLKIELEEGESIIIQGLVMWGNAVEALKKFQHGIEFIHGVQFQTHEEKTKKIIEDYIKFRSSLVEVNLVETLLNIAKQKP